MKNLGSVSCLVGIIFDRKAQTDQKMVGATELYFGREIGTDSTDHGLSTLSRHSNGNSSAAELIFSGIRFD